MIEVKVSRRLRPAVADSIKATLEQVDEEVLRLIAAELDHLEFVISNVRTRDFHSICEWIKNCDRAELIEHFGIEDDTDATQWLRAAFENLHQPIASLAAIVHTRLLSLNREQSTPILTLSLVTSIALVKLGESPELVISELERHILAGGGQQEPHDSIDDFRSAGPLDIQVQTLAILILSWLAVGEFSKAVENPLLWLNAALPFTTASARHCLSRHLGEAARGPATILVWRIALALNISQPPQNSVALLESWLGIEPGDYSKLSNNFVRESLNEIEDDEAVGFVIELAESLGFCGRNQDKLRLIEHWLGTARQDYSDPSVLAQAKKAVDGLARERAAALIHELGVALGFENRDQEKTVLMLSFLGLSLDEAATAERHRFVSSFEGISKSTSTHFLRELSAGLAFVPHSDAIRLRLLTMWVGLPADLNLSDADFVGQLSAGLDGLPSNTRCTFAHELASAAGSAEGNAQRLRILKSWIESGEHDLVAGGVNSFEGVEKSNVAVFLRELSEAYSLDGRFAEATNLLETLFEIGENLDYRDSESIKSALSRSRQSLGSNAFWTTLQELGVALNASGRHEDCLLLVLHAIDMPPSRVLITVELFDKLDSSLKLINKGNALMILRILAVAMSHNGWAREKLAVLIHGIQLDPNELASLSREILRARFAEAFQGVSPTNAALYVRDLSESLRAVGNNEAALAVLEGFLATSIEEFCAQPVRLLLGNLSVAPVTASNLVQEASSVLSTNGRYQEELKLLSNWAGLSFDDGGISPEGAVEKLLDGSSIGLTFNNAIAFGGKLADALYEVGHAQTARAILEILSQIDQGVVSETQCIFLAKRLKLLRPDALEQYEEVAQQCVDSLRSGYSRPKTSRDDQKRFIEHVSGLRRTTIQVGFEALANSDSNTQAYSRLARQLVLHDVELAQRGIYERMQLRSGSLTMRVADEDSLTSDLPFQEDEPIMHSTVELATLDYTSEIPHAISQLETEVVSSSQKSLSENVDATEFRLKENELLLRSGFGIDGRLYWLAIRQCGDDFKVVRSYQGSSVNDGLRMSWANALFELERAALNRYHPSSIRLPTEPTCGWENLPDVLASSIDSQSLLAQITQSLFDSNPPLPAGHLVSLLREGIGSGNDWVQSVAADWEAVASILQGSYIGSPESRMSDLERATHKYLTRLNSIINLESLSQIVSPADDVVLSLEESLFSIPFPFIKVAGEYFFEKVRSIRTSISPLAESKLAVFEQESAANSGLLCVSWFEARDPLRICARQIHKSCKEFAKAFSLDAYRAAGEIPPGSVDSLETGFESSKQTVAVVFGHGQPSGGVALCPSGKRA